jgi:GntR family transcriptional regulator
MVPSAEDSMQLIDYSDPRPIYEQICEGYKTMILKGILEPNEQMPSVRALAVELSTNPNTIQRAYTELERQGFIHSVKGRGNFVSGNTNLMEEKKKELAQQLNRLFKEAQDLGISRDELIRKAGECHD